MSGRRIPPVIVAFAELALRTAVRTGDIRDISCSAMRIVPLAGAQDGEADHAYTVFVAADTVKADVTVYCAGHTTFDISPKRVGVSMRKVHPDVVLRDDKMQHEFTCFGPTVSRRCREPYTKARLR